LGSFFFFFFLGLKSILYIALFSDLWDFFLLCRKQTQWWLRFSPWCQGMRHPT
jgi:hypothetical protein